MAILSPKYPIIYSGSSSGFDYQISLSGNIIYRGHSFSSQVDISNILQNYANSDLTDIGESSGDVGVITNTSILSFVVTGGTSTMTYKVTNDYNDEYVPSYTSNYITSKNITGITHPDGINFVDANSDAGNVVVSIGGKTSTGNSIHANIPKLNNDIEITSGKVSNNGLNCLACLYANGNFITGDGYGNIYKSSDGINWEISLTEDDGYGGVRDFIYVGNRYIVLTLSTVAYSTDLITWNRGIGHGISNPYSIAYNGTNYVIVGLNGRIRYSSSITSEFTDATTNPVSGLKNLYKVIYATRFVAVGVNTICLSNDGNMWEEVYPAETRTYTDVTRGSSYYVAASLSPTARYASSGLQWNNCNNILDHVAASNTEYVGSANGAFWTSQDGITYTKFGDYSGQINAICYGDRKYLAVGNDMNFYLIDYPEFIDDTIKVDGVEIPISYSKGCERYSIYWVNKLGGRSQCLLANAGSENITNNFQRYDTGYDRLSSESFETKTVTNNTLRSWTLYSPVITDMQANDMFDLFQSPKVWLHDHRTGFIYSVVITDSSKELVNYSTRRHLQYTINIRQAQHHIRR